MVACGNARGKRAAGRAQVAAEGLEDDGGREIEWGFCGTKMVGDAAFGTSGVMEVLMC